MESHPNNKGSSYTVKLAQAINLAGPTLNHDNRWEVAMHSIHYTHNFYNFREPCELRIFVEMPAPQSNNYNEPIHNVLSTAMWKTNGQNNSKVVLDSLDLKLLAMHTDDAVAKRVYKGPTGLVGNQLFAKLFLPATHYTSLDMIREDLTTAFNRIFQPCYGLRLVSTVFPKDGTLHFQLSNGKSLAVYCLSDNIATTLGMPLQQFDMTVAVGGSDVDYSMYRIGVSGYQAPKLGGLQAMYVYADIVAPQHVGDIMAPLIDYVDVHGKPGERISHVSNPLVYLPVDKTHIDSISIRIADEHGDDVPFPVNTENVVVRMLFRKAQNQYGLFV
jgi:hypothetical protein